MRVCIVWEDVPEHTYTYALDFEGKDLAKVKACHGHFINSGSEPDELQWLMEYLEEKRDSRKELDEPLDGPFDCVVVCGFLL
jgi:hypothetical protein